MSEQFFFDANVDIRQVEKIVKSMERNNSPGIDKIPLRVIKDCLKPPQGKEPSISKQLNFGTHWTAALKLKPTLKDFKSCLKKNLMLNFL